MVDGAALVTKWNAYSQKEKEEYVVGVLEELKVHHPELAVVDAQKAIDEANVLHDKIVQDNATISELIPHCFRKQIEE